MNYSDPVLRTHMNYSLGEFPTDKEHPSSKSLTVPDMATPLKDLMERYIRGRDIPMQKEPVFEEHLNLPDVRTMTKVEKEQFAQKVRAQIADHRSRLQQAKKASEEAKKAEIELKLQELETLKASQTQDLEE